MGLNTKPLARMPQRQKPLTETQRTMLGEMRDSITATMLAGDLTPHEAASVLRRLIVWLESPAPKGPADD